MIKYATYNVYLNTVTNEKIKVAIDEELEKCASEEWILVDEDIDESTDGETEIREI